MKQIQPRDNRLGAGGWFWGGNYKLERYLYTLHRVTGLGLILFVMIHLVMTTVFRIQGQDIWESTIGLLKNPVTRVGELLVAIAFVFHGLNGLRLTIQEVGFALGKPKPPIYPYKDALRRHRSWTVGMVVAIAVICVFFFLNFIIGGW